MRWIALAFVALLLSACATEEEARQAQIEQMEADDAYCRSWGVEPGHPEYPNCRAWLVEMRQRELESQRAAYGAMSAVGVNLLAANQTQYYYRPSVYCWKFANTLTCQ